MSSKKHTDLGDELKNIVSDAVDSLDFSQLSKNVSGILNDAVDISKTGIKKASDALNGAAGGFHKFARAIKGEKKKDIYPLNKNAIPNGYGVVAASCGIAGIVCTSVIGAFFSIGNYLMSHSMPTVSLICTGVGLIIFSVMTSRGRKAMKLKKAFKNYCTLMENKPYLLVDEAVRTTNLPERKVIKSLDTIVEMGGFPEGHISPDEKYFFASNEVYNEYLEARSAAIRRKEALDNNPNADEIRNKIEEGREHIRKIREANEAIPGEKISKKLDDTEVILNKIFNRIEDKPEILPDVRKLLDYYLPIVQKLLDAYIRFDNDGYGVDNATDAKNEIEKSLDSINIAFENLYNDMFRDEKVDIISDISVLNSMFAQEGLNKDNLRNS